MRYFKNLFLILTLALMMCFGALACVTSQPKTYEVYFETGGLYDVPSQYVKENMTAIKPDPEPTNRFYNFAGWYENEDCNIEFNFDSPITQDTTVYAKWTEKESTYTIKFDNQGKGNKVSNQYIEAETNGKITKPKDPSVKGWKFLGWSLQVDGKNDLVDFDSFIPSSSTTLYAQWIELFTVSFNLNNTEALYPAPETLMVESGTVSTCPPDLLPVAGYTFLGWYTKKEGGERVDFNTTPISENTIFYAQWNKTDNDTIDYDAPYTDNNEEAGFGERPDLDGFRIDGKMGDEENWDEQIWYETSTLDENKVRLLITTKFSEKGLYLFVKIKDDNGINFVGRYYSDRNSNVVLYVTAGDNSFYSNTLVRMYRVDSDSLYPCDEYVKVAPYIAEGKVNSEESATLQVEAFLLWSELQLEGMPQSVKINPVYNYKTKDVAGDLLNAKMGITLSNVSTKNLDEYAVFDKNGYVKNGANTEILGNSNSGVSMSEGWNLENENAENDAYVSPKSDTKKAIFFKNIYNECYEAQTTLSLQTCSSNGKAGVVVYSSAMDYVAVVVDVNDNTFDKTELCFSKYVLNFISSQNGVTTSTLFYEESVGKEVEINLKVLYTDLGLFVKINNVMVDVLDCAGLSDKQTVVGLYSEGCKGLKFSKYSANAYTTAEGIEEAKKYAYLLSVGKTRNLTIEVDKRWIDVDGNDKTFGIILKNPLLALSSTQRNKIKTSGVVDSGVRMNRIDKLFLNVNGVDTDITSILTSQSSNGGKYILDYPYEANGTISNTSVQMQESELVACVFNLVDEKGNKVNATAQITTNYLHLCNYEISIMSGDGVLVLPKGYQSKVIISIDGYNEVEFTIDGSQDMTDLGDIQLVVKEL